MSKTVNLTIDDKQVSAQEGEMLLWVALENDIYIPHLCAMKDYTPYAACRLCFVEVEGKKAPVTSCTQPVYENMVVHTRSERVDELVKKGFELIMSNHHLDCKNCPGNKNCELQKIAKARKLPLKPKKLIQQVNEELPIDDSMDKIVYDPRKCVLCGKCITACKENGNGILNFAHRGIDRVITTFGNISLKEAGCLDCGACAEVCPVGARSIKE
ncbi:MAG: (2Fe-2S)-binding protein [Clostridiales bacterium]|nr:(2Fe-2S)-binding protein [Clostridiales bacterium]MCF8021922.1 (2Fe-2S)-binding protein [Clostridiales bacterium]